MAKGGSIFTKGLKKKAFPDYSPNYEFGKRKATHSTPAFET